jgi:hypothetical protein
VIDLRLRAKVPAVEMEKKIGKILGDADYNLLITGPARVRMPDNRPLAVYLPGVLTGELDKPGVYEILHSLQVRKTNNRGLASGSQRFTTRHGAEGNANGNKGRTYSRKVASTLIGAVDPAGQQRACRLTAWTGENMPQWEQLSSLFQAVAQEQRAYVPERAAAQQAAADSSDPAWIVPGTPFSTITVNNCVDPATECLSRDRGWITYEQLSPGNEILAYDPVTRTTRWEPVSGVFVNRSYAGSMTLLSSREWSSLVTPDHRWPVRQLRTGSGRTRRPVDRVEVFRTHELPRGDWALIRSAAHEAPVEATYSDAFVRVVAWYFTEGNWRGNGRSLSISQSDTANPQHVDSIRRDLKEIGARPVSEAPFRGRRWVGRPPGLWFDERQANQHPGIVAWTVTGLEADRITECAPGADKVLSMGFLSRLTEVQLDMFVEACLMGDGTPERRLMYQHHDGRMGSFMAAAVLSGRGPSVGSDGTTCALNETRSNIRLDSVARKDLYYEGTIWCPTLPSGHWVARRYGKTFVTGNTYPTGVHTDKGDLDAGFSTIACLRRGEYTGGRLVFPEYRVAVDMHHGDLLLMDAHQYHGNTALVCACGTEPNNYCRECGAERISVVSYFRSKVTECGSPDEELRKATGSR